MVLDKGRLVECGVHDELMARGGLYAELFRLQFGGQMIAETEGADATAGV